MPYDDDTITSSFGRKEEANLLGVQETLSKYCSVDVEDATGSGAAVTEAGADTDLFGCDYKRGK